MIAVLGANGYIGAGIARVLAGRSHPLSLYCREPARLPDAGWPANVKVERLDDFTAAGFGLIINCIGAGAPSRVASLGSELMSVTQFWDERVLSTMDADAHYVFLSSGAIYGAIAEPPSVASTLCLTVNYLERIPPYTAAKLCAELRHRHLPERHILDARVFGYAAINIPLDGGFFLSDLMRSVVQRVPLTTTPADMIRDYVGTIELLAMIDAWRTAGAPNCPLDCYTLMPAKKTELIAMAVERYGMQVEISNKVVLSTTGLKPVYASSFKAAAVIGFEPQRTSLEIVQQALDALLSQSPSRTAS